MCLLVLSVFAAVTLCATGLQDGHAVLARRSPQQSCDVRYAVKHRMAVEHSMTLERNMAFNHNMSVAVGMFSDAVLQSS
jgi:hypothetical protein